MTTGADLSGIPGFAKNGGGYVYVIAFSGGMVKVGKTQNARARIADHRRNAKLFGQHLTECWTSPAHDGWEENEQSLMRLAGELGGTPLSPEYFTGITFAALAGRAQELPFPAPYSEKRADSSRRLRGAPEWFREQIGIYAGCYLPYGDCSMDEAVGRLTDEVLRDKDFARLLAERYVRKSLKAALIRELDAIPKREEPVSEPPDPEPPIGGARPGRTHLALLTGGVAA